MRGKAALLAFCLCATSAAVAQEMPSALAAVAQQAGTGSRATEYLEELCDRIGSRLTGTAEEKRARAWAAAKLRQIGLVNVRQEPWQLTRGWQRISAQAEVRLPTRHLLTVSSLGWAGSTRLGGAEGDLVRIDRDKLASEVRASSGWRSKVLLLAGTGANPLDAIAQTSPFLKSAHAAGAIAVIDATQAPPGRRANITQVDVADPVTAYSPIPVVRLAPEHQAILTRLLARGEKVRMWVEVRNRVTPGPVPTANVIGEIPGAGKPEEIVLLGAHLDSWDLGQGAADDGFGIAALLGAAEAIVKSGQRPKRTIRFALFSGEEQGVMGSQAYVKRHGGAMRDHVAAVLADMGDGPTVGLMLNGRDDLAGAFEDVAGWMSKATRMKITPAAFVLGDSISFTLAGVPALDLLQESGSFQDRRHSMADTFDKVKPENLTRAATALAVLALWLANRPERLSQPLSLEETRRQVDKIQVGEFLKLFGLRPLLER